MEIIKAIIYGIIEGITEWLPISSTGHLILLEQFLYPDAESNAVTRAFLELFRVVVQLGAILAVVTAFFRRLWPFYITIPKSQRTETFVLWGKIILGCLPAAIIGLPLDSAIDKLFFNEITVAFTLVFYGVLFIIIENRNKNRVPHVTDVSALPYKIVLFIGLFQVLALIPGTSRSGATILGAILLGVSRSAAAEFSFLLAVPVMFGASALKLFKFFGSGSSLSGEQLAALITGTAAAYAVSFFTIKFLINFVRKHDFKPFGYYRIGLGLVVLLYFFIMR